MFIEGADSQCTSLVADLELDRRHGSRSILLSMLTQRGGGAAAGADGPSVRMSLQCDEEKGMDPCHNDLIGVYDDSCRVF
jgi:hypothetical protein